MRPRLEQHDELSFVGIERLLAGEDMPEIPKLWERFGALVNAIPDRVGEATYGLCRLEKSALDGNDALLYAAAVQTKPGSAVPEGMVRHSAPKGRYAVWTHHGHITAIGRTWDAIWEEWLPASDLEHRPSYDFERYDTRWNPQTHVGPVEIWIAVK